MGGPVIHDRRTPDPEGERDDVIAGLLDRPARVAPKYFYDDLGCALYGAICRLDEYYPTRTEIDLFEAQRLDIAAAVGKPRQFVDLGAGDCCKAKGWIPFLAPSRYVAVDFAAPEIAAALSRMVSEFPGLELVGLATDFSRDLDVEGIVDGSSALFFYPGSSIGNFSPPAARSFLAQVHALCRERPGSGLLIGVDGKKPKALLDAAYDDSLGVTAAFNRNLLRHLNAAFGFDFDISGFAHRGFYNEAEGRIEMHLESVREQGVSLGAHRRRFAAGERIHTENSYKYAPAEFEDLLARAGFASVQRWDAESVAYSVFYAR